MQQEHIERIIAEKIAINNKQIDDWVKFIIEITSRVEAFNNNYEKLDAKLNEQWRHINKLQLEVERIKSEINILKFGFVEKKKGFFGRFTNG